MAEELNSIDTDLVLAVCRRLTLTRPIVFLDLETTGLDVENDRIIEMGAVKVRPTLEATAFYSLFDPEGRPISPDATAKHGITDADVAGARKFKALAGMLCQSLTGVDLAAYNGRRFDARLLQREFERSDLKWTPGDIVDPLAIWSRREPRDLAGAVKRFAPEFSQDAGGHRAIGDVLAVLAVLNGQLDTFWQASSPTVSDLVEAGRDPAWIDPDGKMIWQGGVAVWNVGTHSGTPIRDLPRHYVDKWLMPSDFPHAIKAFVLQVRRGEGPEPGYRLTL